MLSKTHAKYIQSLHHKKFRDAENCFIAEGGKVVLDLLSTKKFRCREVYGLQQWLNSNEAFIRKYFSGPLEVIQDFELEKISALITASQALAVFEKVEAKAASPSCKIVLLLDDIQDPGNLGTTIRIADWFGIKDIVCSLHTADMYNPKVVQSTMGSLGRVNILYADLPTWVQQQGAVKIFAAALNGKNLNEIQIKEGVLIIGNESKGISEALLNRADEKITIPRYGEAESLNAAVATGIILSHIVKN
jgi:RNA methyltransferase, TrmH family